jgi:hypothetical protein
MAAAVHVHHCLAPAAPACRNACGVQFAGRVLFVVPLVAHALVICSLQPVLGWRTYLQSGVSLGSLWYVLHSFFGCLWWVVLQSSAGVVQLHARSALCVVQLHALLFNNCTHCVV